MNGVRRGLGGWWAVAAREEMRPAGWQLDYLTLRGKNENENSVKLLFPAPPAAVKLSEIIGRAFEQGAQELIFSLPPLSA